MNRELRAATRRAVAGRPLAHRARAPRARTSRSTGPRGTRRLDAPRPRRIWVPSRADVIEILDREGLLPAITFIFSRAGCDAAVAPVPVGRAAARDPGRADPDPRARPRAHRRTCPTPTCACSATGSGSTGSSAGSPPTTPGCCRGSRRSPRSCSPTGWSRPSSRPRRWRSASTCRPARSCWNGSSSTTARRTSS